MHSCDSPKRLLLGEARGTEREAEIEATKFPLFVGPGLRCFPISLLFLYTNVANPWHSITNDNARLFAYKHIIGLQ